MYGSKKRSEIDLRHNVATDIGGTFADPSSQPRSTPFTGSQVPLASTGGADSLIPLREVGNEATGNRDIPLPHHARVWQPYRNEVLPGREAPPSPIMGRQPLRFGEHTMSSFPVRTTWPPRVLVGVVAVVVRVRPAAWSSTGRAPRCECSYELRNTTSCQAEIRPWEE